VAQRWGILHAHLGSVRDRSLPYTTIIHADEWPPSRDSVTRVNLDTGGTVATTGEFLHIEHFVREFRRAGGAVTSAQVPLGPGDDAAVFSVAGALAVTTDAVFENVHFRRDWGTWEQVGHKALAVNLSDLAAMGARPVGFTCAFGLPAGFEDGALTALARGMARLAARHEAILAGGNFSKAGEVSVTITALGQLDGPALRRDAARVGDLVLLTGDIGVAAAELKLLQEGSMLPPGRSALLEPSPLVMEGHLAANLARCAIDVSDGLVQDLGHVARASAVRICIDLQKIPTSLRFEALTARTAPNLRAGMQLAGGEDYALVVIAPAEAAKRLCRDLPAVVIGAVDQGTGVAIENLPPGTNLRGHDHFH
jgi:thiamine-monophosphate kinase